jgi:hypothetical protein
MAQKFKQRIWQMCLRFQFCTHQRVCLLHFLKESQIRCTLMYILAGGPHHKGSGSAAPASVSARTTYRARPRPSQHHSGRRAGGPAGRPGRLGAPPRLLPHHQRLRRVEAAVDPAELARAPAQARQSRHSVRLRSHHGRLRVGRVLSSHQATAQLSIKSRKKIYFADLYNNVY